MENPFHPLPPALEPTFLQNMLPHGKSSLTSIAVRLIMINDADAAINAVIWPGMRDKLITAQNGQNALHPLTLIQEMEAQTTVHPGQVSIVIFWCSFCTEVLSRICLIPNRESCLRISFADIRMS